MCDRCNYTGTIPHKTEDFVEIPTETISPAFKLLQEDPHQWSSRGCPTCRAVSALIGQDFGCVIYAKRRKVI
jgi:hypothetical protein